MATKAEMQAYLDAMLSHVMEKNKDAIAEAYWLYGAAMVTWEDGEIVVRPVPPEERFIELQSPQSAVDNPSGNGENKSSAEHPHEPGYGALDRL